jgi:hypothetical protein
MPDDIMVQDAGVSLADVIPADNAGGDNGAAGAGDGAVGGGDAADGSRGAGADGGGDAGRTREDGADSGRDGKGADDKGEDDAAGKTREDVKGEEDEEEIGSRGDGRRIEDAKLRRGIANLRKQDKEAGKAVADAYYANQDVMKLTGAPSVKQAINSVRAMKATIDSLGGEQGITETRQELEDWRTEAKQFADGDPALIESLGKANPESLARTTTNALEWLAKNNHLNLLDEAVLPNMVDRLQTNGYFQVLDNLEALIKKGDGQGAYDLLTKLKGWSHDLRGKAEKFVGERANRKAPDPKAEEYARKDAEYAKRDQEQFNQNVNRQLTQLNNSALDDTTKQMFNELGLKPEGRRDFVQGLMQRIWDSMAKDKIYQGQVREILRKNDSKEAAEFIAAEFSERLPEHFIKYRNIRYPNYKPSRSSGGGSSRQASNGNAGGGDRQQQQRTDNKNGNAGAGDAAKNQEYIQLKDGEMPTRAQVDWKKTSHVEYISGRATLVNGKRVKWRVRHG